MFIFKAIIIIYRRQILICSPPESFMADGEQMV